MSSPNQKYKDRILGYVLNTRGCPRTSSRNSDDLGTILRDDYFERSDETSEEDDGETLELLNALAQKKQKEKIK